jgi:hypothetical protein
MRESVHSPVGASGADRWMNCSGSVRLPGGEWMADDEPEYRTCGSAAHECAAECLRLDMEIWEAMGQKFLGVEVDEELARGVQVYLNEIARIRRETDSGDAREFIEFSVQAKAHPLCYGTLDYAQVRGVRARLRDYKNGAGVVVEVKGNPQFLYYAYLLLDVEPALEEIEIGVVQPNAFHPDGPVRIWTVSAAKVREWAETEMLPKLTRAVSEASAIDLWPGPWCRFCPKKLGCPTLASLFRTAATADPNELPALDTEALGRAYAFMPLVKKYLETLEAEIYRRLNGGEKCAEAKLVLKKTDRVWKPEAQAVFVEKFGDKAFSVPTLLSPAAMEKIDPDARSLVKEWAYTPLAGTTVALRSDKRTEIEVRTSTEVFGDAVKGAVDG